MSDFILAIDQGTTSSRAIVFNAAGQHCGVGQQEFAQHYPKDAWVEHDPEEIWQTTLASCRAAIAAAEISAEQIATVGITNQRETTLLWDRETGEPVYPAIVWQDRRTAEQCVRLKSQGLEEFVRQRTGLLLDPYFSATKLAWILDNVDGARERAEAGKLAFGTVDCFLLWRLTGGKSHATDATNASRTLLFNIHRQQWDAELLRIFDIPAAILPEVKDNCAEFGRTDPDLFGASLPIQSMIGDQQAATVGQACFVPGMVKSTYGTGCFVVLNTGDKALVSSQRLLTTIAYQLDGKPCYALEGSIFVAGAAVQWLRDGLKLIGSAAETQGLAESVETAGGVYMIPAFTGLGAPYWDPDARGAILGLTRDTGIAHIARATLESVCYQTRDLLEAMRGDGANIASLRVDGGMVVNDWLVQRLADTLGVSCERPQVTETTALGAAYLAGLQAGLFDSLESIAALWQRQAMFEPQMPAVQREQRYHGWKKAVSRVRTSE
ncbi:glycerol kinase GlpK [Spongiibacter sp. KMU-158]|uniref:Glycerol kinase n=1 Tax=Spongiibacter pelagi TaxID=2760804 RepID=A0A927GWM1_9GAMM|nr:glycerol kinase GlpK [Spongiibacter pelagi]MBD2858559.1 glycerol kinase GlpK [Spongiibacter pelagi]